jgi:hypothetical protein
MLAARRIAAASGGQHKCIALVDFAYCESRMQTLVLRIPQSLAEDLEAEARRCQLSKSEVARRRLIAAGNLGQKQASGFELIADLVGSVAGKSADLSSRKKHYLKSNGYGTSRRHR